MEPSREHCSCWGRTRGRTKPLLHARDPWWWHRVAQPPPTNPLPTTSPSLARCPQTQSAGGDPHGAGSRSPSITKGDTHGDAEPQGSSVRRCLARRRLRPGALRAGNVGLGQPFPAQDSLSGKGVWCCAGSLLEDPLSPTGSLALRGLLTALLPHRPLPMVLEVPVQPRVFESKPPGLGWKPIYLSWGLGVVFPSLWIPNTKFPEFCDLEDLLFAFLYPRECPTGERSGGPNHHDHLRGPVGAGAAPTRWGHRGCKAGVPKCRLAIPWWGAARGALGTVGQSDRFPSSVGFGGEMVLVMEQRDNRAAVFGKPNVEQLGGTGVHWTEASWSCWGLPWGWLGPGRSAGPWGCSAPPNLGGDGEKGAGASQGLTPCASVSPAMETKAEGSAPPAPADAAPPLLAFRSPAGHPAGHEGQASSPIPLAAMWVSGCEPAPVPWSWAGEGAVGPKWNLNPSWLPLN